MGVCLENHQLHLLYAKRLLVPGASPYFFLRHGLSFYNTATPDLPSVSKVVNNILIQRYDALWFKFLCTAWNVQQIPSPYLSFHESYYVSKLGPLYSITLYFAIPTALQCHFTEFMTD